jgi:hypothetical protein
LSPTNYEGKSKSNGYHWREGKEDDQKKTWIEGVKAAMEKQRGMVCVIVQIMHLFVIKH